MKNLANKAKAQISTINLTKGLRNNLLQCQQHKIDTIYVHIFNRSGYIKMKPGNPKKAWWFLILTLILLMIIAAIGVWSKQAREPTEARMAAQKFIDFLYTDDFRSAYELTAKSGYVGKTEAEFVVIARREQCPSKPVFISTFPFQSNGNWLRRWVNNKDQGMDRINIEFRGEKEVCLLGVTIQKMQNQSWRVTRFGRHAG